jgi:hypothetical protein
MARQDLVETYLNAINIKDVIKNLMEMIPGMVLAMIKDAVGDEGKKTTDEFLRIVDTAMHSHVDELRATFIQVYAENYTDEEMEELIRWNQSDIGRQLLAKNNTVLPKVHVLTNRWAKSVMDDAVARMLAKENPKMGLA